MSGTDQFRDRCADTLGMPKTRFLAIDIYCQQMKMKRTLQNWLDLKIEIDHWPADKKAANPEMAYGYSRKQLDAVKDAMLAKGERYDDEDIAKLMYRSFQRLEQAKESVDSLTGALSVIYNEKVKGLPRRERRKALRHNGNHRRAH